MNQMSKFELNPTVNESKKSILLKLRISEKIHSRPATNSTRPATARRIRIREITSNITVS